MRFLIPAVTMLAALAVVPAAVLPAWAQNRAPQGPRALGTYQGWTAATHTENGQKICFAFTRATRAEGVPGRTAQNVTLMVTHRPQGRDQVAVRNGFTHGRGAEARLIVAQTDLPAYTSRDSAFLRDGRAAVGAMRSGREAMLRSPGPNGRGQAQDIFPLAGFAAAYDAISRECPAAAAPAPAPAAPARR